AIQSLGNLILSSKGKSASFAESFQEFSCPVFSIGGTATVAANQNLLMRSVGAANKVDCVFHIVSTHPFRPNNQSANSEAPQPRAKWRPALEPRYDCYSDTLLVIGQIATSESRINFVIPRWRRYSESLARLSKTMAGRSPFSTRRMYGNA